MITIIDEDAIPAQSDWLSETTERARITLRTDSRETQLWATLQNGGLALLPCFRADGEAALRRLDTPSPPPGAEIWIAVHRDQRHMPRIRAVLDCIAEAARRSADDLCPDPIEQRTP